MERVTEFNQIEKKGNEGEPQDPQVAEAALKRLEYDRLIDASINNAIRSAERLRKALESFREANLTRQDKDGIEIKKQYITKFKKYGAGPIDFASILEREVEAINGVNQKEKILPILEAFLELQNWRTTSAEKEDLTHYLPEYLALIDNALQVLNSPEAMQDLQISEPEFEAVLAKLTALRDEVSKEISGFVGEDDLSYFKGVAGDILADLKINKYYLQDKDKLIIG